MKVCLWISAFIPFFAMAEHGANDGLNGEVSGGIHRNLEEEVGYRTFNCGSRNPCTKRNRYKQQKQQKFFPADDPCRFVQCGDHVKCFMQQCAPGTIWNQYKKACVNDKSYRCPLCVEETIVTMNAVVKGGSDNGNVIDVSFGMNVKFGINQHINNKRNALLKFDLRDYSPNSILGADLLITPNGGSVQGSLTFGVSRLIDSSWDETTVTMFSHNDNVALDSTCAGSNFFSVKEDEYDVELTVDVTSLVKGQEGDLVTLMIDQRFNTCTPDTQSCGVTFDSKDVDDGAQGPFLLIKTLGPCT